MMIQPEEILACEDIEELEAAYDEAYGYCAKHNSCDPGCRCFNDDDECIFNMISHRLTELERGEK